MVGADTRKNRVILRDEIQPNPFCVVWSFSAWQPPFRSSRRSVERALRVIRSKDSPSGAKLGALGMLNESELLMLLKAMTTAPRVVHSPALRSQAPIEFCHVCHHNHVLAAGCEESD